MLQERAWQIAEEMSNLPGKFKASNGQLQRFRKRHMVRFRQILSESASVITVTTDK